MAFILPELPYGLNELEPYFSQETLEYHYGKHHNTYVVKLNGLVEGTDLKEKTLVEIIKSSQGAIFNNAAQVWNHTFYWNCLSPNGGGIATGEILDLIVRDFGSFESFKEEFTNSCINNFGSGWTWLVKAPSGKLEITNTSNAMTPLTTDNIPLLTCDVWEHAYYIDYRNVRPDYLAAFWNLVHWDFVNNNLK